MNDLTLAKQLIKVCLDTQTPFLDLGKCGITNLNDLPELFECIHLETLILSNHWWEDTSGTKKEISKNAGGNNTINSLPIEFKKLVNLKKLLLGSDGKFRAENINVLYNCQKLEYLDLRANKINDISILQKFEYLKTLFLFDNKINNPACLNHLLKLENLDLGSNEITEINFLEKLSALTSLDLNSNKISDISFLENLTDLQSLNISDNEISDISFLEKLTDLQSLNISDNEISDISFLEKLTGLQTLDLSDNEISDISFLEKLTGLQTLDLSGNQISDISFLVKLTSLQSLNISDNEISDISFLEKLTGLQTLDLSGNQISDISFLEKLTVLQFLELNNNQISDISFLEKLTSLQSLDLRSNKISDYSFIEKLTGLQSIDLSYNQISDISFLEKLTVLQSLYLSYNEISDISFLVKLTSLESLDLGNNQISDISFLEKLTSLQSLDLRLSKISDYSFIEKLTGLQSLDLRSNKISDISFLEKLTVLQSLNLSYNQISDISFLEKLTVLQSLNLSYNEISDISFLEKLTSLESLDLGNNQISDISFLEKLTSLESLELRSNYLKKIPLSIFQLSMEITYNNCIIGLCVNDNPIESPPLEIIKQGRQSVLDWFESTKKKLNEIKIILIGEPKSGKTSLLKKLKFNEFNKDEVQTDGVNIEDIEFGECNTFKKQTSLHNLTGHFWDFGGQEIMNATHQFFLTKRSVYVLILDARKDANNSSQIREWVKRVKATGGDSPIIVLANQIDVNPGFGFENERELQNEFPQIKCFIKVSCSTNENIDLLKDKLEELIPKAELFQTDIDERWITIKEKLQEETKANYFLDETRFLQICNYVNLKEKDGQKNAITFLHDLGLILHFDDLNLSEYYVLDPYWITYGVYQILTSVYAGNMKGKVSMDKLEYIVNDEIDKKEIYNSANYEKITYTTYQRGFLIDILHQFKLCFCAIDHSYFIVPDLLDTKEPLDITEPIRSSDENIQFVYSYEYLPKSIMPNIMVETHRMITGMWRTGCMLNNDGCNALITNYQNRISIIVTGEYKKKREFMSVIRFIIESINLKLSNKPVALIPLPGINAFADYEQLIAREKKGKRDYIFDEDKPTEKTFPISTLLDGIPSNDEVRDNGTKFNEEVLKKLDDLKSDTKDIKDKQDVIIDNQAEIISKLNLHYDYLINLPDNNKIKEDIQEAIQELNAQQTNEITGEIMDWITSVFTEFDCEIDDKFKNIYNDLKKTDNLEMKLKLSIPFINLLGIDFETKFDVKNWAKEKYKKHELKIFKLMGLL